MPEQRRRKAAAALAAIPAPLVAQANRDRAGRHLARVAAEVAGRHGYADLGSFVLARIGQGASLAAISREAGLNKDWLSRHLDGVDPVTAEAVRRRLPQRPEARWQPVLSRFGFPDVPSYLRERHLVQHWTVNAIAAEAGLTHHTVEGSLRRHGLTRIAHAAKRHQARQRAAQVAARLGFASMADYVADRRSAGWTWDAMAAECAQPPSWLRRQAQAASAPRPYQ
jgi:lambda repressor-like predicted transcriptional regulator